MSVFSTRADFGGTAAEQTPVGPPPQRGAPTPRRPCLSPGRLRRHSRRTDAGRPSSATWGPNPTAAVPLPGPTSAAQPPNRRRSALLRNVGPQPHGGRASPRADFGGTAAEQTPVGPPPQRGAPTPRRPCLSPGRLPGPGMGPQTTVPGRITASLGQGPQHEEEATRCRRE